MKDDKSKKTYEFDNFSLDVILPTGKGWAILVVEIVLFAGLIYFLKGYF